MAKRKKSVKEKENLDNAIKAVAEQVDPIPVTDENKRTELDAMIGRAAEWEGVEGTVERVSTWNKDSGYPEYVVFRPRPNPNTLMSVRYDDVKALRQGFRGV